MNHPQALATGTRLVQDYEIQRILGAGGFGITYLAEELPLARSVTLKEYFPVDFATRTEDLGAVPRSEGSTRDFNWGLDRFLDEAQTLARFDHPNIVKVYRYFRANGTAYMALKWEEGQSLKSWLKDLGRTPRQAEIDAILEPLLAALEVVHASDFLHRDIAPDNIILRTDGSPVLIDFGSARGDLAQRSRTVSALVKPGYSPYEQYSEDSANQGPWTDIYALAATLYHLTSGKRPQDAPARIVGDELRPAGDAALGAFRPAFLDAIDQALALDIAQRPQTVAAWRALLFAGKAARPVAGTVAGDGAAAADPAPEPLASGNAAATRPLTPSEAPGGFFAFGRNRASTAHADKSAAQPGARPKPRPPQFTPRNQAKRQQSGTGFRRGGLMSRLRRGREGGATGAAAGHGADTQAALTSTAQAEAVASAVAMRNTAPRRPAAPGPKAPYVRRGIGYLRDSWRQISENAGAVLREAAASPVAATAGAGLPQSAMADEPVGRQSAAGGQFGRTSRPPTPPAGRALQAIAAIEQLPAERKPPRVRRNWRTGIKWRSVVFKLVLGALIAAGAVSLQQSLPTYLTQRTAKTTSASIPSLLERQFNAHAGGVSQIAFGQNGRSIVTTGADNTLKVWSVTWGSLSREIAHDYGPVTALSTRGSRAVTGHAEGDLAVWDLVSGERVVHIKRNEARIWDVTFIDDASERIAVAAHDWSITLWDLANPQRPLHIFEGHENPVQSLAVNKSAGLLISGGADRTLRIWNLSTLSLRTTRKRVHGDFVTSIAISSDYERLASGDLAGGLRLWSGDGGRRLRRLRAHDDAITALAFIGGRDVLASASKDGRVRLWNMRRGSPIRTLGSKGVGVNGMVVTPDGAQLLTAGADGTVRVWRTRLGGR